MGVTIHGVTVLETTSWYGWSIDDRLWRLVPRGLLTWHPGGDPDTPVPGWYLLWSPSEPTLREAVVWSLGYCGPEISGQPMLSRMQKGGDL